MASLDRQAGCLAVFPGRSENCLKISPPMVMEHFDIRGEPAQPSTSTKLQTEIPVLRRQQLFVKAADSLKRLTPDGQRRRPEASRLSFFLCLIRCKKRLVGTAVPESRIAGSNPAADGADILSRPQDPLHILQQVIGGKAVIIEKTQKPSAGFSYAEVSHPSRREQPASRHDPNNRGSLRWKCGRIGSHDKYLVNFRRQVLSSQRPDRLGDPVRSA